MKSKLLKLKIRVWPLLKLLRCLGRIPNKYVRLGLLITLLAFFSLYVITDSPQLYSKLLLRTPVSYPKINYTPKAHFPKFMVGCNPEGWLTYVMPEFYYVFSDMESLHGWEDLPSHFYDTTNITLRDLYHTELVSLAPKVLFFCENNVEQYSLLPIHGLQRIGTTIVAFSDDLHMYNRYSLDQMRSILKTTDVLIGSYAYQMAEFFAPALNPTSPFFPTIVWSPHAATPNFFNLPFQANPMPKIFVSGASSVDAYPIRHYIMHEFAPRHPEVVNVHAHPGYGRQPANQSQDYALEMSSYLAVTSTTSFYRYLVCKTFEIPATGSLLLINLDLEQRLADLGMLHMTHYVGFSDTDPDAMLQWAMDLENRPQVDRIRQAGMQLVRNQHTTRHRADAINTYFETGVATYAFSPKSLRNFPCPMINTGNGDEASCMQQFTDHERTHFHPKE